MPTEFHPSLPMEQYAAIPAVNFSTLKHILRSPKAYQEAIKEKEEDEEVLEKYAVGNLVHALVLEGKDMRSCYAVKPTEMSFTTKEGKAWRDAQTLPIITEKEMRGVPKMAEAVANDPDASDIIRKCTHREFSVVVDWLGVPTKCRFDGVFTDLEGRVYIVDLKTCIDAREDAFSKSIFNYDYDFQMEMYSRIYELAYGTRPGFIWMAVEKRGGFDVQLYMPDDKVQRSGHRKVERAMELYRTCSSLNEWPGYERGIKTISLPKWAEKEL